MINLFALTKVPQYEAYRIPLSQSIQEEITTLLQGQKNTFIEDKEPITFTGSYSAARDEIFQIQDYEIGDHIMNAIQNPLGCDRLDLSDDIKICALFAGEFSDQENYVCFQVFDSRRLIVNRGISIIHSNGTYHKLEEKGLVIAESLTALFKHDTLYFTSYHNTRRFLDLISYFEEATNADIDQFVQTPILRFEDENTFKESADSIIRKKIKLILTNGTLDNVSIDQICQKANDFDIKIGTENGQIQVPTDRKKAKELIRFLDEDYFLSSITNQKYLTNSKRAVN